MVFSQNNASSLPAMILVPLEEDHTVSITHTWSEQLDSRPRVKESADISRLKAPQSLLTPGPMQSGPICHMAESPASQLHQLKTKVNLKNLDGYTFPLSALIGRSL